MEVFYVVMVLVGFVLLVGIVTNLSQISFQLWRMNNREDEKEQSK
jgi:hypothetical protein